MDMNETLNQSAVLSTGALALASAEYLTINREFGDKGAFSWRVFGSRPECVNNAWLFRRLDVVFGRKGAVALQGLRLVSCVLALAAIATDRSPVSFLLVTVLLSLLHSYRGLVGADGSDQMSVVVLCALCLAYAIEDDFIREMCVVFIAVQAILSYSVAGVAKLWSPKWRDGSAIREIMNTRCYGHAVVARFLNRATPLTNLVLSWQVMCIETAFLSAVFLPYPWIYLLLGWGFIFHLLNALVMGLNTFFFAFVATYPCVLLVNNWIVA